MTLDLRVQGDPAALRATAAWLGAAAQGTQGSGVVARDARTGSEHGWRGTAGDGFRSVLDRFADRIAELSLDLGGTRDALTVHAADLDDVHTRMRQAREIAASAGLVTTDTAISEPGPAPLAPAALPIDRAPTAPETQAFEAGRHAVAVHAAQVAAFGEAARVVAEGRAAEAQAQGVLHRYLSNMAGRAPFVVADVAANLPGATIRRTSKFRDRASLYAGRAAERARLARGGGPVTWIRHTLATHYHLHRAERMLERATPTAWSRVVDRLPSAAKARLIATVLPEGTARVLSRIPVVSLPITLAGIGFDIYNGRDPVHAAASGVSSLVAGAVVGSAIGGPVGLVAGAVVGAGVGFVVDEWGDDAARFAGAVGTGAWEAGEDIAEGIGTGIGVIREVLDGR